MESQHNILKTVMIRSSFILLHFLSIYTINSRLKMIMGYMYFKISQTSYTHFLCYFSRLGVSVKPLNSFLYSFFLNNSYQINYKFMFLGLGEGRDRNQNFGTCWDLL
jgi:hypothetical protein